MSRCRGVQDMSKAPRMIYGYLNLWLSNRSWSLGSVFSFHPSGWEVFSCQMFLLLDSVKKIVILNWTHC